MSRIKNLNDRVTLKNKLPSAQITVWKGSKKEEKRIGKDLNNLFRIETDDYYVRAIIKKNYKTEERGGSLFVSELNIIPAYDDINKSLISEMTRYSGSRIVSLCDRETIHTTYIETNDVMGSIYYQPIESKEGCPVAGTNHKCPLKCSLTGNFYFYIYELLLSGSSQYCRLQTHSFKDNIAIADTLDRVNDQVGHFRKSPFITEETRHYMVYRLTRKEMPLSRPVVQSGKRTGNRFNSTNWELYLELHPIWKNKYDSWLQLQQIEQRSLAPSNRLLTDLYGSNIIDVSSKPTTEALPEAKTWDNYYKEQCAIAYKQNNWDEESFLVLLNREFDGEKPDSTWQERELKRFLRLLQD